MNTDAHIRGYAATRWCVGCGARISRGTICAACLYTDRVHGTHVVRPGHPCPICGAEALR